MKMLMSCIYLLVIACAVCPDKPNAQQYNRDGRSARKFVGLWVKSWLKTRLQEIERNTHTWLGTTRNYRKRCKERDRAFLPSFWNKAYVLAGYINLKPKRARTGRSRRTAVVRVLAMTVVAASAMPAAQGHEPARKTVFDTDSRPLKIDNHASKSITNDIKDVLGRPDFDIKYKISGVGGDIDGYHCTVKWTIEDDNGVRHDIKLPNAIYSKDSPSRILSPQHWAQEAKDNTPNPRGTWCATYDDAIVLHWDQEKYVRTVTLDKKGTNVATIRTSPGFLRYKAIEAEVGGEEQLFCYDANIISDDKEEQRSQNVPAEQKEQDEWT